MNFFSISNDNEKTEIKANKYVKYFENIIIDSFIFSENIIEIKLIPI